MSEILVFMSIMFGLLILVIYAIGYVLAYKIGEIKEQIEEETILLTGENIDEIERVSRAEAINIFAERLMEEKGEPDGDFYWWVSFEGIRSLAEEMLRGIDDKSLIKTRFELFGNSGQLVKTNDILVRENKKYEVVIADDNIFVICPIVYDKDEQSKVVKYDNAEIYANQKSINTLEELCFEMVGDDK